MASCIIFGGAGYIGTNLATYFLENHIFDLVQIADIKSSTLIGQEKVVFSTVDVRKPIELPTSGKVAWIFNLAAVHREPGHTPQEYFETNTKAATNICHYASEVSCNNLFFSSSIAIYGPSEEAIAETNMPMPTTPYGISKLIAEQSHFNWLAKDPNNRLIICRPGVIYGPKDPGNILRMIKAMQKGYFFLPGSSSIHKSYGYIFGLIDSIIFAMKTTKKLSIYNYVEYPTQTLAELIVEIKAEFNIKAPVIQVPYTLVYAAAAIYTLFKGEKSAIHPRRVKKITTSTHIIPQYLIDKGFSFNYNFRNSLKHWKKISPEDFK